jgi:hypothetical protein
MGKWTGHYYHTQSRAVIRFRPVPVPRPAAYGRGDVCGLSAFGTNGLTAF